MALTRLSLSWRQRHVFGASIPTSRARRWTQIFFSGKLTERHVDGPVLRYACCAESLVPNTSRQFERIYPDLAAKYGVSLYPFFLEGVATDLKLVQHDGLHPNPQASRSSSERILPKVEELIAGVHVQQQVHRSFWSVIRSPHAVRAEMDSLMTSRSRLCLACSPASKSRLRSLKPSR